MGSLIITGRSILWVFLTMVSTLMVFTAIMTPKWLIGATRNSGRYPDASVRYGTQYVSQYGSQYGSNSQYGLPYGNQYGDRSPSRYDSQNYGSQYDNYYGSRYSNDLPSVGLFNRCTYLNTEYHCANFASEGLGTYSGVFPVSWKMSVVCFVLGLGIMCITIMLGLISCCTQTFFKKSIFTVSGSAQVVAGLLFIIGIFFYAVGWGSKRVERLCGPDSGAFSSGDCSFGWAFWTALFGTLLTFITACLSMAAEKATSSDKVSKKLEEGETLVCLM